MKLLLSVTSTNEYANDGCDAAYIDLTPEMAQCGLRRIELFKAMQAADPQAVEAYFWDYSVKYFDPDAEDGDRWENCFVEDGNDSRILSDTDPVPLDSEIQGTECDQMCASADEIAFTAIPKNGSHYVRTGSIGIKTLREAAETTVAA